MNVLLVIGAGGHSKVVADVARAAGFSVAGHVDSDPLKSGTVVGAGGARVVADQAALLRALRLEQPLPGGATVMALGVGHNVRRLELATEVGHDRLPVMLHPTAVVSPSARLGSGTIALPAAVINADAHIGAAVIVNTSAVVEHDCVVDEGAHISPGAVLAGGVAIGARSWIGAGAVVIEGVTIGKDVTVGAGAVVLRDVPDGRTVVGVPARPVSG